MFPLDICFLFNDFLRLFDTSILKKRKKSRFLKSEKKHKIRILEQQWRKRIGPKEIEMPLGDKLV